LALRDDSWPIAADEGMIHFTVTLTASTPCNLNGTQLLALMQQQGFGMLDISNPQVPQQTAILFDGVIIGYDISQLAGTMFMMRSREDAVFNG
jgi:hypothetical protein